MVKTPTYPLAAFNYVTLCSFKVYRQITRGHLLCTVEKLLTWSSEISLLMAATAIPESPLIPRPTATPPYDPSSDFVVQRGSRFTHSVLLGAGRRSVVSCLQFWAQWLSCMTWPIKQLRVEFAVLHEAGGGHPCKSWPGVPRFPMVSHGFWCMISPALWLSWILKPRYFQACLAIQEALAFQEPA